MMFCINPSSNLKTLDLLTEDTCRAGGNSFLIMVVMMNRVNLLFMEVN